MKGLLSNRTFFIVTTSDILQNIGIWIRNIAVLFFVIEQTNGNPIAVSALTVAEYLPIFIFSIVGGVLADRWQPKRMMIWGDVLSFVSIVIIIFFVMKGYWLAVFAATMVSAIVSQFSQPSSSRIFKQHIPEDQIPVAIATTQTVSSLFIIGGPIIGTAVYSMYGLYVSLTLLLVIFALSALLLSFLPNNEVQQHIGKLSLVADMKEATVYLKENRNILIILLMFSTLAFGMGLIQPLEIFIITDRLHLTKENLQWFTALAGLGMLLGGIVAAISAKMLNGRTVIVTGLSFLGISTVIEVISIWPYVTGTMRFLTGIFMAMIQTILSTFMLTTISEKFVGRMNGLITPIFTGFVLIGTSLSGFYMKATSLVVVFTTAGIIFILASLIGLKLSLQSSTSNVAMEKKSADSY